MDLWIRSQDKKLLEKVNSFEVVNESTIQVNGFPYGTYATEERALEVLNEIQKILKPKIIVQQGKPIAETLDGVVYRTPDEVEIKELSVVVYEMPKE